MRLLALLLVAAVLVTYAAGQCVPANTTLENVIGGTGSAACVQALSSGTLTVDATTATRFTGEYVVAPTLTLEVKSALTVDQTTVRGKVSVVGGTLSAAALAFEVGSVLEFRIGESVPAIALRTPGNLTAAGSLTVLIPAAFVFDIGTRVPIFAGVTSFTGEFTIRLQTAAAREAADRACSFGLADADGSGEVDADEFAAWTRSSAFAACGRGSAAVAPRRSLLAGTATSATLDCTTTAGQCALVGSRAITITCPPCPSTKDNAGLAVGILIGVLAFLALIAVIVYFVCAHMRRRKRKHAARLAAEDAAAAAAARMEAESLAKREKKKEKDEPKAEPEPVAVAAADVDGALPAQPVDPATAPTIVSSSYSSSSSGSATSGSYFSSYY